MDGCRMNGTLDTLPSGVTRVRHALKRRQLTVTLVLRVSPALIQVTLHGTGLHDFVSLGFDDHVRVFLPSADPNAPVKESDPNRGRHLAEEIV